MPKRKLSSEDTTFKELRSNIRSSLGETISQFITIFSAFGITLSRFVLLSRGILFVALFSIIPAAIIGVLKGISKNKLSLLEKEEKMTQYLVQTEDLYQKILKQKEAEDIDTTEFENRWQTISSVDDPEIRFTQQKAFLLHYGFDWETQQFINSAPEPNPTTIENEDEIDQNNQTLFFEVSSPFSKDSDFKKALKDYRAILSGNLTSKEFWSTFRSTSGAAWNWLSSIFTAGSFSLLKIVTGISLGIAMMSVSLNPIFLSIAGLSLGGAAIGAWFKNRSKTKIKKKERQEDAQYYSLENQRCEVEYHRLMNVPWQVPDHFNVLEDKIKSLYAKIQKIIHAELRLRLKYDLNDLTLYFKNLNFEEITRDNLYFFSQFEDNIDTISSEDKKRFKEEARSHTQSDFQDTLGSPSRSAFSRFITNFLNGFSIFGVSVTSSDFQSKPAGITLAISAGFGLVIGLISLPFKFISKRKYKTKEHREQTQKKLLRNEYLFQEIKKNTTLGEQKLTKLVSDWTRINSIDDPHNRSKTQEKLLIECGFNLYAQGFINTHQEVVSIEDFNFENQPIHFTFPSEIFLGEEPVKEPCILPRDYKALSKDKLTQAEKASINRSRFGAFTAWFFSTLGIGGFTFLSASIAAGTLLGGLAVLGTPIGLGIIGLTVLVAGVAIFVKHWSKVKQKRKEREAKSLIKSAVTEERQLEFNRLISIKWQNDFKEDYPQVIEKVWAAIQKVNKPLLRTRLIEDYIQALQYFKQLDFCDEALFRTTLEDFFPALNLDAKTSDTTIIVNDFFIDSQKLFLDKLKENISQEIEKVKNKKYKYALSFLFKEHQNILKNFSVNKKIVDADSFREKIKLFLEKIISPTISPEEKETLFKKAFERLLQDNESHLKNEINNKEHDSDISWLFSENKSTLPNKTTLNKTTRLTEKFTLNLRAP